MLKVLKYNKINSSKVLEIFLGRRKSIQKKQIIAVSKIIKNVKKNGDKAVLNYEKKFSKIKKVPIKYFSQIQKLTIFQKKLTKKSNVQLI